MDRRLMLAVCFILPGIFCPARTVAQAKQGQARIDSLLTEVPKMKEDTAGVMLLYWLAQGSQTINVDDALVWGQKALARAQAIGWRKGECLAYNVMGGIYQNKAAYPLALDAHFKALRIAEEIGDKVLIGSSSLLIGNIHYRQPNPAAALDWYSKGLKLAEEANDKRLMERALGSLGLIYSRQGKYEEALDYYFRGLRLAEELDVRGNIIIVTVNIAGTYSRLKKYPMALAYTFKALRIAEAAGMRQLTASSLGNVGYYYFLIATDSIAPVPDSLVPASREANLAKAVEYLNKGIVACRESQSHNAVKRFSECLSDALAAQGDYKGSYESYRQFIALSDSLFSKENDAKIIRTEESYKFSKKADSIKWESDKRALAIQRETELAALTAEYAKKQVAARTEKERQQLLFEEELKRNQIEAAYRRKAADAEAAHIRKATIARLQVEQREALTAAGLKRQKHIGYAALCGSLIMLLIAGIAFRGFRNRRASNRIIAREQQKSETLLRNILPADVAEELMATGATIARQYKEASVLYTDFVDFTGIAEHLTPSALVMELHEFFSAFDTIVEQNGLEKIKTIGDAYIAVCGLPQADPRHAQRCVQAAIEIRDFVDARGAATRSGKAFQIRIGINSGPVLAGIVGVKKFAYDIWGDTVNTAARMQQCGVPGRINISGRTYELVKDEYYCRSHGALAVTGKDDVEMYFAEQKTLQTAEA